MNGRKRGEEDSQENLGGEKVIPLFMGEYRHIADSKGRLIIPSGSCGLLDNELVAAEGWMTVLFRTQWTRAGQASAQRIGMPSPWARAAESEAKELEFRHHPVMLEETISQLRVRPDGIYVDGTVGGGGHAFEVCRRLSDKGHFYGMDQDEEAVAAAGARLERFGGRVTLVHSNYARMREELKERGVERVDGILLDLGVSSYQLDEAERGFTYRENAPLDMRMDRRQQRTARDIVNGYGEEELYRVIRDYGEDRFARSIVRQIVREREKKPIETTGELAKAVRAAVPAKYLRQKGHPAKQTFQAIRIELNQELFVLQESLDGMIDLLEPGGRICVITFHSLEDRIVKTIFRRNEAPCTCPPSFPVCVCGKIPKGHVVTRKPIFPSEEELERNSRSKSAKLRVFERA